ncbi:MAG TPA: CGNR zinc finger domain-containing protein [Solirubrobacteraceae bacterium]|nr:CGNR zinc finger domain-containing protein [Solirubrobacteraceae bacterium]
MKQRKAPGELEQVRAFVNTRPVEPAPERLADPAALAGWLAERGLAPHGLRATRADLAHALELREALRAMLVAHAGAPGVVPASVTRALDQAADRARLVLRFAEDGGAMLVPDAPGVNGALGRLLAVVHAAIAQGIWTRLKACREPDCEWAFYDHTKNRSGAWCSMEGCGNRAKARAYRERHAPAAKA